MGKKVDLAYELLRRGPREHLSGVVTGIWLGVATNVIANAAMDSTKATFFLPGLLALVGCCLWHYYTSIGQEQMREMDGKLSRGESVSDIASDAKDSLQTAGNSGRIVTSFAASIVIALVSIGWLAYLVLDP